MPLNYISRLKSSYIIGCFFILFICAGLAYAQNSTPLPINDTTKVQVIEPIALSNLGTETESTLSKIREVRTKIKPTDLELEIDSLIPLRMKKIEQLKIDLDLDEIGQMNLRQTESLKNEFTQLRVHLEDWRSSFMKKTEEINEMKLEIGEFKIKWEKTLNKEREEKLPDQVTERIQNNLSDINTLEKELTLRINALLTKQDELTGALIFTDEVLVAISKTEQSLRSQILTIDSPPIWHVFNVPEDTVSFRNKITHTIEDHNDDFISFKENYKVNIYYHILFFVVLFFLTVFLKNDVAKWSDEKKDEAIRSSLHVISRPFTSSLLVTLLVSGLFYSDAPQGVLDYYYALLMWPILTIVPGLIPSIPKKYFYIIGSVFLFSQIRDYFSSLVVIERILLLFIDLVTIILLIILIRKKKSMREETPNVKWGFVFTILRIALFLLIVSALANVTGNTVLSKILFRGSLSMIYGGTIIYASALILRGLFALIIQQDSIAKLNMIINYPEEVKGRAFQIIRWSAVIYWLYITLSGYLIYEPIYDWITELITTEWQVGSLAISIGSILAFFITLWISLLISKFIRFILQDEILTHFDMPRGVPGAISMLVRLVLITLGFVLAFGAAKIPFDNIAIIFGALGVGIGFGLQNIFNNLVSGLILAFERPIQVGDVIQIATLNLMGEVKEIGIRASIVRTFDGAEVVVPNGNLISNEMINWTLSDHRRRQEILVGVAYGTNTNKVMEILNEVVPKQDNVLKNPAPFIIFIGFGESSLDFRVLFWTHFENGMGTKSAVGVAIDEAFKKNGIEIPFPQRDLHVRSVSDKVDFQKEKKPAQSKTNSTRTAKTSVKAKDNEKK